MTYELEDELEVITIYPEDVSVETVDGHPTVRIEGKIAAFCRQVDLSLTVDQIKVTLHRYVLKGDRDESTYWRD